jgi:endonuclease VIII
MPEGHTIHRAARLQSRRFGGAVLRVWSPQGRFSAEAEILDGGTLESVEALGKHLFYRWLDRPSVHVHLGLFGKFRVGERIEPSVNARMAWASSESMLALSGPTACDLIDHDDEELLRRRIGPDPLMPPPDALQRVSVSFGRRRTPVGAVLLDQSVIAGVGNVYRAEILFLSGIHPLRESRTLSDQEIERIWEITVSEMTAGERVGRIVTRVPAEVGVARRSDVPAGERLYAYKRRNEPCRRCGEVMAAVELAGRPISFCPACQRL